MKLKNTALLTLLLFTAFGCLVPGLSSQPQPIAAPALSTATADNALPTLVAAKVQTALTETALAAPPTATVTNTPEPPTATVTLTPTPPIGSSLTTQADGATQFSDERAGYTILIPAGWLVVRSPNQPEFGEALTKYQGDALVYEILQKASTADQSALRLLAVDLQTPAAPPTTIQLILDESRAMSFNSDQDLQAEADQLVQAIPNLEITALDILMPPSGMQFGAIETAVTGSDDVVTYEKRVYFMGKTGLLYAWLTTSAAAKETIIPAFDAVIDTIKITAQ